MSDTTRVAFIGLGSMGSAIAANIQKSGAALTVYNRTAARAQPLVDQGATLASSPAAAAHNADVVFTMLSDDAATESVVFGDDGFLATLPRDAVHVAMSTISVPLSQRLTQAHADAGQHFVAAPVLGRPDMAALGKLFVVASGKPAIRDRVRPLLECVGQRVFDVAETPSQSTLLKLIANFMITTVIESLSEATALARKNDLAPEMLLDVLTNSIFSAPVYKTYGSIIAAENFSPAGFGLPLGQKDNRLLLQAAEASGVPVPLASLVRDRFLSARAQGMSDLDWSAIALLSLADAGIERKK